MTRFMLVFKDSVPFEVLKGVQSINSQDSEKVPVGIGNG